MNFLDYILLEKELLENSLYANQQEKEDLLKDKQKVIEAFLFNFVGILGLINGSSHKNDTAKLRKYFMNDKKVFISNIDETNNDMSLVIKLMDDKDMFISKTTVNEITRFLARLKKGLVEPVDSSIVASWLKKLKPDFVPNIKDPKLRSLIHDFMKDGGETIDLSKIAILLKSRMKILEMGGEFVPFAKRFKILEVKPTKRDLSQIDTINDPDAIDTTKTLSTPAKSTVEIVPQAISIQKPEITQKIKINYLFSTLTRLDNSVATKELKYVYKLNDDDISLLKDFVKTSNIKSTIENIENLKVPSLIKIADELYEIAKESNIFQDFDKFFFYSEFKKLVLNNKLNLTVSDLFNYEHTGKVSLNLGYYAISDQSLLDKIEELDNTNLTYKNDLKLDILEHICDKFDVYDGVNYHYGNELKKYLTLINMKKVNFDFNMLFKNNKYPFGLYSFMQLETNIKKPNFYSYSSSELDSEFLEAIGKNSDFLFEHVSSFKSAVLRDYRNSRFDFLPFLKQRYKESIEKFGISNSLLQKDGSLEILSPKINQFLQDLDISLEEQQKKFPLDSFVLIQRIRKEKNINFLSFNDFDILVEELTKKNSNVTDFNTRSVAFGQAKLVEVNNLRRNCVDMKTINDYTLKLIEKEPKLYDNERTFLEFIMKRINDFDKEQILKLVKVAKDNSFSSFFKFSTKLSKSTREEVSSLFTSVMNDCIGTEYEDYISDILDTMPYNVIGEIRKSLVGIDVIIGDLKKGNIDTFSNIDSQRMKIILQMNDLNLASIVSSDIGRKKKSETWLGYIKRAKEQTQKKQNFLQPEKLSDSKEDIKALTKLLNETTRSNKHGDTYCKVLKVYDSNLKFDEFDEFRKNHYGDGVITPAFHGTGGIAASMILRYGFKVIKASDSSVVGRMLGDGIYFTNKIDKAMQYVGNSGFARKPGTKGYIFLVDNTLGKKDTSYNGEGPDYRVMGLGTDGIKSPEWCIRDPKKQLAITKVYEVEFITKNQFDNYLAEDIKLMGFKTYLSEKVNLKRKNNNTLSFRFRDGKLPIIHDIQGTVRFIDFEEALNQNLVPSESIDYSSQGPVVIFENVDEETTFYDFRFGESITGNAYILYEKYFSQRFLVKDN